MFQIGDQVVYGSHGVCRIVNQEERVIDRKRLTYLVLEPEGQDSSQFLVPSHNEAAMAKLRPMLSKEELEALLVCENVHADGWIADSNQRKNLYRELISSGDREKLMQMVCSIYRHKAAQTALGKKIHQADENFLKDAEKVMVSEFSIVLGLDPMTARTYIREKLKEDA